MRIFPKRLSEKAASRTTEWRTQEEHVVASRLTSPRAAIASSLPSLEAALACGQTSFALESGISRIRLPVAAWMAL